MFVSYFKQTEDAKKRESIPDPVSSTNVCKKIPEATVSISRKIERIEKAKDSVDELKESRQKVSEYFRFVLLHFIIY